LFIFRHVVVVVVVVAVLFARTDGRIVADIVIVIIFVVVVVVVFPFGVRMCRAPVASVAPSQKNLDRMEDALRYICVNSIKFPA